MLLEADKNRTYNVKYKVMPNLTTDVFLGLEFLSENDAVINFEEGLITLDGKQYEIPTITDECFKIENFISDKTRVLTVTTGSDVVTKLIKTYQTKNPELGSKKRSLP